MKAALQRPDLPHLFPHPPQLQVYETERRFYQEFGAAQPPLHLWPERKLRDYTIIMQVVGEVQAERDAAQTKAAQGGRGGGTPGGVEEAFANLPRAERPPPA